MPARETADMRRRLRATTPTSYRWWWHVALIALFAGAGLALALVMLGPVGPADGLGVVGMLVAVVLGEYAAHRLTMHRPRFPRAVHHRHVVEHHAFFTEASMAIEGWSDLRWVLFPPWALPLLVASVLPFVAALWWLASPQLAGLLLLVVIGYYATYEIVHTLAHVPVGDGPLGRIAAAVTRHHRVHHDPTLMHRWNFNFVLPLGDWLCGTTWRGVPRPGRASVPSDAAARPGADEPAAR